MSNRKDKSPNAYPHQIGLRLTEEDFRRLEKLAAHVAVGTIARIALITGLNAIERQPAILVGEEPTVTK